MVNSLEKNQDIGDIIRAEVKNAILNKTTDGLNQFINKLGSYSQHLLFRYLIRREFPFSPDNSYSSHLRIKFDTIKGLKILKIPTNKAMVTLTKDHISILWAKVYKQLQLNDNFFSLLKYYDRTKTHYCLTEKYYDINENNYDKMDTKNIYDSINDRYAIKNNLNISNDSSNNYEYGPQGVPSQKRSRYKRRYHRK